jgi:N-acetylglucosaminyldiphosphoundecaprenol N-acetyl-beta-D-mannosaminyltransferase
MLEMWKGRLDGWRAGGVLVVPAAPALREISSNGDYREALMNADVAIADSALMVLLWNLIESDSIPRISGLKYLRVLLEQEDVRTPGNTLWVMAGAKSGEKNRSWLRSKGIDVPPEYVYEAPMYGNKVEDSQLIDLLHALRPQHVIITLGGGTQERLGLYLKRNLDCLPAIHCIGAAIAFLSGDQVRIPDWADRLYLGWLFRCLSSPRRFVPRYLSAPQLVPLLWHYRNELPALQQSEQALTQAE